MPHPPAHPPAPAPAPGRPRASSREVLAEAACELFLEQGYEATTVADITRRAGVSRSSFFNYFASKSDLLWSGLDAHLVRFEEVLREAAPADEAPMDAASVVARELTGIGHSLAPDSLVLALGNAAAMGLDDELERESARRLLRIAEAIAGRLRRAGVEALRAEVIGAAYGGAVIAALRMWADEGAGRTPLPELLERATLPIPALLDGGPGSA
ncbi:MAG: TetR family transcriptional regulator [Microbacteriaceae bacterium]|nr:TetR family transcriptional regulator [Microbacteriaceae bacterium]